MDGGAGVKRTSLKRRTPLKQQRQARARIDRQAAEAWAKGARSKPCVICGSRQVQGHHIITQQKLREVAIATGRDFERLRWDARNRLSLCSRHHAAHHNRSHPIPWQVMHAHAPKAVQFARELGLVWWLERTYPDPLEMAA